MPIISTTTKSYIAGFLDGDGCIMFQLIHRKDYVYGYQIRNKCFESIKYSRYYAVNRTDEFVSIGGAGIFISKIPYINAFDSPSE